MICIFLPLLHLVPDQPLWHEQVARSQRSTHWACSEHGLFAHCPSLLTRGQVSVIPDFRCGWLNNRSMPSTRMERTQPTKSWVSTWPGRDVTDVRSRTPPTDNVTLPNSNNLERNQIKSIQCIWHLNCWAVSKLTSNQSNHIILVQMNCVPQKDVFEDLSRCYTQRRPCQFFWYVIESCHRHRICYLNPSNYMVWQRQRSYKTYLCSTFLKCELILRLN